MWFCKKLFGAKKIQSVVDISLLYTIEEGHRKDLLLQKQLIDEKHQRELKTAYYRGHWEAQAEIFAAIRREPDKYHEFIEEYRAGEIPPLTWENVDKYVQALKSQSKP